MLVRFMQHYSKPFGLIMCAVVFMLCKGDDWCSNPPTSDNQVAQTVQNQQAAYDKGEPIPTFNASEPRHDLIQIYQAVVASVNTWTVFYANNGVPEDMCPSRGFPIPVTDQLTNPSYLAQSNNGGSPRVDVVMPQPEPTGLYTGPTQGTWVLCIHDDGTTGVRYAEPNVMAYDYPVQIVDSNGVPDSGGKPGDHAVAVAGGKPSVNIKSIDSK